MSIKDFSGENLLERDLLKDLGIDKSIILKRKHGLD
jgi:hypothetical protein